MKVSVIIPCYNSEKYLFECLDSLAAQTMSDYEVLLVDDGSVDDTLSLLRKAEKADARLHVFHQENAGVSAARNLALAHAQGEWVTFVDADDILPKNALETMLNAADDSVDMVVCSHVTFDENGREERFVPSTNWPKKSGQAKRDAIVRRLIEGDSVLNIMCNKLHRRSLIEREQIRLRTDVKIAEDALFNLEVALCGEVRYVNAVTYRYRTHSESAMNRAQGGQWALHEPWLAAMRELLCRRGVMGRYYTAFFDSTVLRLYKDGSVSGVMKEYNRKARELLNVPNDMLKDASTIARLKHALGKAGAYPIAYPLFFPFELLGWKIDEYNVAKHTKQEVKAWNDRS